MPTVLRVNGYRFFFYSLENCEPAHIHVEHGDGTAKFWLDPINLASTGGFRQRELNRLARIVERMSTLTKPNSSVVDANVTDDVLHLVLADGREVSAPVSWFPRLRDAPPEQRSVWRIIGAGEGIHWPQLDEDISVASLLRMN